MLEEVFINSGVKYFNFSRDKSMNNNENNPWIFIGSSSESLKIANACNVALEHHAEVTH